MKKTFLFAAVLSSLSFCNVSASDDEITKPSTETRVSEGEMQYLHAIMHNPSFKPKPITHLPETEMKVIANTVHGFSLYTHRKDLCISEILRQSGNWQPDIAFTLKSFLKPGDKVIHLGGHIGFDDIIIGQRIGHGGELHIFEPNPETFDVLRANMEMHQMRDFVRLHPVGVWSEAQTAPMHFTFANTGGASLCDQSPFTQHVDVQCVSLDEELSEISDVAMIFMDIEGAEIHALQGAKRILERSPACKILLEWSTGLMTKLGADLDAFIDEQLAQNKRFFKVKWEPTKGEAMYIPMTKEELLAAQHSDILIVPTK